MSEREIIEIFNKIAAGAKCPKCGHGLTGGYYDPEELVKGPSDGVVAIKVSIETVLKEETRYASSLALFIECQKVGESCDFREPFFRFFRKIKKAAKIERCMSQQKSPSS